jgi:16S rRNA G527 N7-methylase RsmG
MSKSFESNMAKELNIKELTVVAKRIEKYQS